MTTENIDLCELPRSWVWTQFGIICEIKGGFAFKSKDYQEKGIPLVRISNINKTYIDTKENVVYISREQAGNFADFELRKGDILIALSGATTGKFGVHSQDDVALLNQRVGRIRPYLDYLPKKFIFHYLGIIRQNIFERAYGAAQPNISVNELMRFPIPFPPLNELHRIVARLEELFSRLDAGVEGLRKVKAQLKRYRQAVLKYAFEGKLTEEWRKTHTGLRSVLAESPVAQNDNSFSSNLPKDWLLLTIPNIVSKEKNSIKRGPFGSSIRKEFFQPSGYKVYEQKNVIYSNFNLGNYYIDEDKFLQLKDFELKSGDVVITCSGTIGKIAIATADLKKGIINQALLKLKLDEAKVSAKYFLHLFTSKIHDIILDATRGSAMKNISSVKDLKQMLFPIPPFIEQQKIVEEIEQRFSVADEIEKIASQTASQAERLRQGILKQAFEGKLVPQDPSDEPADKLLQRIREERAKSMGEKDTNKKKIKPKQLELSSYVK